MLVFNSEMHVLTLVICILEFGMFCYQLVYYFFNPEDRCRYWYMVLLALLLVYNITGGLLPDKRFHISATLQNIIAYGSGFVMASYFPYYFYRAFNLKTVRFHAVRGVFYFLLLPYIVFFWVVYPITKSLEVPTSYGMIVPFLYSIVVLYVLLDAIRLKIRKRSTSLHPYTKLEMMGVYAAVSPWIFMSAFGYFHVSQWIEALVTNSGFLVITILFITKSVKRARMEREQLKLLERMAPNEEVFEANLLTYGFTAREIEIIRLVRLGHSYTEMAEILFIAPTTISRHMQNIHSKAEVKSRLGLIRKLEEPVI